MFVRFPTSTPLTAELGVTGGYVGRHPRIGDGGTGDQGAGGDRPYAPTIYDQLPYVADAAINPADGVLWDGLLNAIETVQTDALAIAMGASAIETDVRMTTDGALVLFHDGTVDRTSDGAGPVDGHTLDELRRLDLGGWFAPRFAGERVLTLGEMLDEYVDRVPIVFEIEDPRTTRPLVEALAAREILPRVQVTSFF